MFSLRSMISFVILPLSLISTAQAESAVSVTTIGAGSASAQVKITVVIPVRTSLVITDKTIQGDSNAQHGAFVSSAPLMHNTVPVAQVYTATAL